MEEQTAVVVSGSIVDEFIRILVQDNEIRLGMLINAFDTSDIYIHLTHPMPVVFLSDAPIICFAAFFRACKCFQTLIEWHSNTSLRTNTGLGLSHFAASGGCLEIVQMIDFQSNDSAIIENAEFTPVHAAAAFGHVHVLQFMFENKVDMILNTPYAIHLLCYACQYGYMNVVEFLKSIGDDFSNVRSKNESLFCYLCRGEI